MAKRRIGMWMYKNSGGKKIQKKIVENIIIIQMDSQDCIVNYKCNIYGNPIN